MPVARAPVVPRQQSRTRSPASGPEESVAVIYSRTYCPPLRFTTVPVTNDARARVPTVVHVRVQDAIEEIGILFEDRLGEIQRRVPHIDTDGADIAFHPGKQFVELVAVLDVEEAPGDDGVRMFRRDLVDGF